MNEVFDTGMQFWQLILLIITVVASFVVVKFAISFDVNKYLERKDKRLDRKIKNVCPHVEINQEDKEYFSIKSLFESPPGSHKWQCRKCGLIRNHNNDYEKEYEYWGSHTSEYLDRIKQFEKLLKKAGAL
jgi:hypothetical protein